VPLLPQALEVLAHTGFAYNSHRVRLSGRIGTGYWFGNAHELLLVGVRGSVTGPAPGTQWESAWDAPVGLHSEKPELGYKPIERYFPTLPKIELNARRHRNGWECWGAEAPPDLEADCHAYIAV
jgi:N6-adenosine-specific RNA methylase IME4